LVKNFTSAVGLVHIDFTDANSSMNVPAASVIRVPSSKLFSIAIHNRNDSAVNSAANVRISTNVDDQDTRARLSMTSYTFRFLNPHLLPKCLEPEFSQRYKYSL
jgi:hypothetical protein